MLIDILLSIVIGIVIFFIIELTIQKIVFSVREQFPWLITEKDEIPKILPHIPEKYKNNDNRIFGCASMAWVKVDNHNNKYSVLTDSDTFIVKGLLSILKYIIDGITLEELDQLKIEFILKEIGLEDSITSQRTNGFMSALNKIKEQIN